MIQTEMKYGSAGWEAEQRTLLTELLLTKVAAFFLPGILQEQWYSWIPLTHSCHTHIRSASLLQNTIPQGILFGHMQTAQRMKSVRGVLRLMILQMPTSQELLNVSSPSMPTRMDRECSTVRGGMIYLLQNMEGMVPGSGQRTVQDSMMILPGESL